METFIDTAAVVRPMLAGATRQTGAAFEGFVRSGATIEMKAFTGVSGDAGGYAVPREIDAQIDAALKAISPIRSIANVVQGGHRPGIASWSRPAARLGLGGRRRRRGRRRHRRCSPRSRRRWASSTPIRRRARRCSTMRRSTSRNGWPTRSRNEFAKAEGAAFVSASGTNRPKGFLTAPVAATADAGRAFGTLQYLASGAAGDFGGEPAGAS